MKSTDGSMRTMEFLRIFVFCESAPNSAQSHTTLLCIPHGALGARAFARAIASDNTTEQHKTTEISPKETARIMETI